MDEGRATVSRRGAARLAAGHVWVYRSDVDSLEAEPGALARVADARGRELGWAFANPRSEITLRLVSRGGPPEAGFIRERLAAALRRRELIGEGSEHFRWCHAEADGLPGLVVDRYGEIAVVQAGSAGIEVRLREVVDALHELAPLTGVLSRGDFRGREREGLVREVRELSGSVPETVVTAEPGARGPVRLVIDPWRGQKTGAFLDQRLNRRLAGSMAQRAPGTVAWDVFACEGAFAAHLAMAGAAVTAVEISAPALARAARTLEANGVLGRVDRVEANAFDWLRGASVRAERPGLIVLDPPAFARRRTDVERALAAYKEINLRALRALAPGGALLTFSCSFHVSARQFEEALAQAAADAGRTALLRERLGAAGDHPERLGVAETRYLKGALIEAVG
jgi:23S rRNA (cytosine1962-C5)-methyltransferase